MKQNCPKCNNCIHESICHFWVYENYPSDFYDNCTQYQEKRPKGKWIEVNINPVEFGGYTCDKKCPFCGHITSEYLPKFCSHCGANMRGEENE